MNIFEKASRQQLKFVTVKGLVSTDYLWEMQLKNSSGFDLDTVASSIDQQLQESGRKSFVSDESASGSKLFKTL